MYEAGWLEEKEEEEERYRGRRGRAEERS